MATTITELGVDDPLARHMRQALAACEDPEVRFHIRAALQQRIAECE